MTHPFLQFPMTTKQVDKAQEYYDEGRLCEEATFTQEGYDKQVEDYFS